MRFFRNPALLLLALALASPLPQSKLAAQANDVLSARAKGPVVVQRGKSVQVPVAVTLKPGYHVNSSTPSDKYLIPLKLSWDKGALSPGNTSFPAPALHRYAFSDQPLSVYEKNFVIQQSFTAPANAPQGFGALTGKLRYQACTNTECLAPVTIPIRVSYDIR